jgi:hypothetical protein
MDKTAEQRAEVEARIAKLVERRKEEQYRLEEVVDDGAIDAQFERENRVGLKGPLVGVNTVFTS